MAIHHSDAEPRCALFMDRLAAMRGRTIASDVADVMMVVPRHVFVPEAPLSEGYGLGAVVTHWTGRVFRRARRPHPARLRGCWSRPRSGRGSGYWRSVPGPRLAEGRSRIVENIRVEIYLQTINQGLAVDAAVLI